MRVIVYKNLKRGDWSLATVTGRNGTGRGTVIDHKAAVTLANVVWYVSEPGRLRVCKNKCREVHAWAIGDIVESVPAGMHAYSVTYNPYRDPTFTTRDGAAVHRVDSSAYAEFTATAGVIAYG